MAVPWVPEVHPPVLATRVTSVGSPRRRGCRNQLSARTWGFTRRGSHQTMLPEESPGCAWLTWEPGVSGAKRCPPHPSPLGPPAHFRGTHLPNGCRESRVFHEPTALSSQLPHSPVSAEQAPHTERHTHTQTHRHRHSHTQRHAHTHVLLRALPCPHPSSQQYLVFLR